MEFYIGFITPFPWAWAPQDWSLSQGQLLQIQQNPALYSLLGTSFGGNGTTTFALPELRGRQIIGYGLNPAPGSTNFAFAANGGAETVTLTSAQLPAHTHTATLAAGSAGVSVSTAAPAGATPLLTNGQTAYLANSSAGTAGNALKGLYTTTAPATGAIATVPVSGGTVAVGSSGSSSAVSVRNPYLALNFCIALNGMYPSRN